MIKKIKKFFDLAIRGFFIAVPLYFVLGFFFIVLDKIDNFLSFGINGLGIFILFFSSIIAGYFSNSYHNDDGHYKINFLNKVPLINIVYKVSSDIFGTFLGKKKILKDPVLVCVNKEANIYNLALVSRNNRFKELEDINMLPVYMPKPYSFYGDLIVVPKDMIIKLNCTSTFLSEFVISGGLAESLKEVKN
jgi:uncharacterized membrane protein